MGDVTEFIRSVGVPGAFAVALGYALYKVGAIATTLLVDAWKAKDTMLTAFDLKLERIQNGQREALEQRLDMSMKAQDQNTAALSKVAEVLDRQSKALEFFAVNRPCIHDSDMHLFGRDGKPSHEKAVEKVRKNREQKDNEGEP